MKTPLALIAALVLVFGGSVTSSRAVVVLVSGTDNSAINAFLNASFTNITELRSGNFANFAAAPTQTALAGADVVIIGRTLGSADYDNFESSGYNTLTIPVISLTSYVSRQDGNRLGWHAGGATNNIAVGPAEVETTVTAAGSGIFGVAAGSADFFEALAGDTFNGLGTGSLGGGTLLSSIGGQIQGAHWNVGDAPGNPAAATVATFPGERLLFNLDNDPATPSPPSEIVNLTPTGQSALISAIAAVSPLQPVPEPSAAVLGFLAALGLCARRRR